MSASSLNIERQLKKISKIGCLQELDGYELEAKKRGVAPEELAAIHALRLKLTPKKRRRR